MLKGMLYNYGEAGLEKDKGVEAGLKALAQSEVDRKDGYFKMYGKCYGNIG